MAHTILEALEEKRATIMSNRLEIKYQWMCHKFETSGAEWSEVWGISLDFYLEISSIMVHWVKDQIEQISNKSDDELCWIRNRGGLGAQKAEETLISRYPGFRILNLQLRLRNFGIKSQRHWRYLVKGSA